MQHISHREINEKFCHAPVCISYAGTCTGWCPEGLSPPAAGEQHILKHHLHHQDTATESSMSSSTSKYISTFVNLRILYQQNTKTKCTFEKKSFRPNFLGNSNVYLSAKSRVNQIPSLIKSPMEFTSCCVSCANKLKGTISQSPSTVPIRCSRVPKHLKERVQQLPPTSSFYLPGLVPAS